MSHDRSALGAFLRSRRDRITPAQAGVEPFPGPRRVPGLRREELAVAAGLSTDYYSRVEQGRQPNISDSVLAAISRVLRLDEVEIAHLRDLAISHTHSSRGDTARPQVPDAGLLRLAANLDHVPVLLLGQRAEVLFYNELLSIILGRTLPTGVSIVEYLFHDPLAKERFADWPLFAARAVAGMRREAARRPHDTLLIEGIAELRRTDPDIERWWHDHAVHDYAPTRQSILHPAGVLEFTLESITAPAAPDQHLMVYTVEVGSPTAELLPTL
ncbi:helix-turn-helix transcriptional regulator [Kribbella sp. CA-293567]|uniref:helix-turn-helix transcriptional regulator n=1 Tax=Kribbella sp. CA-293567 TaxID=3002436 RepID=UPI0022DDC22D|nr:helix-turn-helix transcriptional regulator [Kribbella sp. CA-293567]WBQ08402.1 helix-turn-helix transcriptional regulator [Kribbella sp. CA-293567]